MTDIEYAIHCCVPNTPPNRQADLIKQLFRDALNEFIARRTPAREYVERRYPDGFLGDKRNNDRKVAEVESRILAAKAMLASLEID